MEWPRPSNTKTLKNIGGIPCFVGSAAWNAQANSSTFVVESFIISPYFAGPESPWKLLGKCANKASTISLAEPLNLIYNAFISSRCICLHLGHRPMLVYHTWSVWVFCILHRWNPFSQTIIVHYEPSWLWHGSGVVAGLSDRFFACAGLGSCCQSASGAEWLGVGTVYPWLVHHVNNGKWMVTWLMAIVYTIVNHLK